MCVICVSAMTSAGVYIHFPFCRSRCSYCDFATGTHDSSAAARYVHALTTEISNWREVDLPRAVDTIYFGGGTPSLLTAEQLERILGAVHERFEVTVNSEITLEINPGDGGETVELRHETMRQWRRLGINRASLARRAPSARAVHGLSGRLHAGSGGGDRRRGRRGPGRRPRAGAPREGAPAHLG